MPLAPGTRFGPYEIVAPLGAGGMGEVYRARDTRLDRTVALKVVSPQLATPELRLRFEREARAISQLSHPHICALYDVGPDFLVMELLEGETLAERLATGALPIEQTLRWGIEVADALDAAHRQGIVHRDLKPANVMLTRSGVKLLDFGLARLLGPTDAAFDATSLATISPRAELTDAGTVIGTLQYISPEQLAGAPADARSDIFALGVLLHEMATGQKAFAGRTPATVMSAILRDAPPPISTLQPSSPAALDRLVRTCLAKAPDDRWQTARDVGLQLASILEDRAEPRAKPEADAARVRTHIWWAPWLVAALGVLAAAAAWLRPAPAPAVRPTVVRFPIPPPAERAFADTVETVALALSPDGSQLAFVAADGVGRRQIWMRPMSAVDARPLAGTDGATSVFWSPDGRAIAFFAAEKLMRLDLSGGTPVSLTDVPAGIGLIGSWGAGDILFAPIDGRAIYRVPAGGGAAVVETKPDPARAEARTMWPWFLPDGRRYLYQIRQRDGSGSILIGERGKAARPVLAAASPAAYVEPGYLVYVRDATLVGQRFDAATERVSGDPIPIGPVRYFFTTGAATFTASPGGTLAYQSHFEKGRITWLDRSGTAVGAIGDWDSYLRVRFAPDGRSVFFDRSVLPLGTWDIWKHDLDRGIETRLTATAANEIGAVGLPDGKAAVIAAGGPPRLTRLDLTTLAQTTISSTPAATLTLQFPEDVSPDGRILLFTERTARGSYDVWTMSMTGSADATPLIQSPFDKSSIRFSRDGRYIAFASDESGRKEVYVAPFPAVAGKMRVSPMGGSLPRWSRDGRELVYISADQHLVAVPIRTAPTLVVGAPQSLFVVNGGRVWGDPHGNAAWTDYDIAPDGKRFLAIIPEAANRQPLTAIVNWPAELAR